MKGAVGHSRRRYHVTHVYRSLGEMLSEARLDSIHVLLPPELHAQTTCEIIAAGVDVLLEKPMATSVDECEDLVERAQLAGVKLGVGHNFLFAPVYERLKQDLLAGRLGRPDEVTITWNKCLGQLASGPFDLWMLREPKNIMLEVGSHSVAHMLDLIGPVKILGVRPTNHIDLPGGARFFRRWHVEAESGSIALTLKFSFVTGFPEHMIHIRGSLGSATVDFKRNTYLLQRHTPAAPDLDRYRTTISKANVLKSQARSTLARVIYSKFRPIAGTPYCQSIAGAVQSFYNNSRDLIDHRLSPKLGREVVRICEEIGQQNTSTREPRPVSRIGSMAREPNGVAPAQSVEQPGNLALGCYRFYWSRTGSATSSRWTHNSGARSQP